MLTVLDYFSKSNFIDPYMDIHNFWNCLSDTGTYRKLRYFVFQNPKNSSEILQK